MSLFIWTIPFVTQETWIHDGRIYKIGPVTLKIKKTPYKFINPRNFHHNA